MNSSISSYHVWDAESRKAEDLHVVASHAKEKYRLQRIKGVMDRRACSALDRAYYSRLPEQRSGQGISDDGLDGI